MNVEPYDYIQAFEVVLSSRYNTGASTCIEIPELILNELAKILLVVLSSFILITVNA